MTSAQSAYTRSSNSPIRGHPSFVYRLDDFSSEFDRDLSRALLQVLAHGRQQLREAARVDPLWAQYEDLLDIKFVNGGFEYVITGSQDQVKATLGLEYGTGEESPHSLLRKMALRQEHELSKLLTQKLQEAVPHA